MPEFPPPSPLPNGFQPPSGFTPGAIVPVPDPIDEAQKAVLGKMRELIVLLAGKDDQRSLVGLRQWAKLMTEARRIAKNRKPRVRGVEPAIGAYFGGDAIDDVNAEDDEDENRVVGNVVFGGLGDQGNLMRGMIGELQAMGGATSAQNEAREIDSMMGAVRMLSVGRAKNKKRAAEMEERMFDIVDKKLQAMEERYVKPPPGMLPAAARPPDPRGAAIEGRLDALPPAPAVPRRARRRAR